MAAGAFTYAELIETITARTDIQTPEDLLRVLPDGFRANYSLVFESRNTAQFASVTQPRVILRSPDAKLLIAAAGDPTKPGYQTVEMIFLERSGITFCIQHR